MASESASTNSPLARVDAALPGLTTRESAILAFEAEWWRHSGAKEEAIRDTFDFSAARYYQVLGVLIDSPDALVADPMLIKRLQRMRAERASARARRLTPDTT